MYKIPHIVILGAGFGGMYVARNLKTLASKGKIKLTIVNKTNYFLFTPLLHEVATGGLSPTSVAEPIREIFSGLPITILEAQVQKINAVTKIVTLDSGELSYDYLVIATGAETNYYDIPGAKEYSYGLKNLADALLIKMKIIDLFEKATTTAWQTKKCSMPKIAIVGGGPTGVEFAAELAEFTRTIAHRYNHLAEIRHVPITLINSAHDIIPQVKKSLRIKARAILHKKKVAILQGYTVEKLEQGKLHLKEYGIFEADMVIWVAGVKAQLPQTTGLEIHPSGRVLVEPTLLARGTSTVFALGDSAAFIIPKETSLMPMLAQVAVQEASTVSRNIRAILSQKALHPFHYSSKGMLVSLGQWFAVGEIATFTLWGMFAWWLWRTVYLFKFFSWRKRIRIVFEWTANIFFARDTTKAI